MIIAKIKKVALKIYKEPQLILKFVREVKRSGLQQAINKIKTSVLNQFIHTNNSFNFFDYFFDSIDKKSLDYKDYKVNESIDSALKMIAFYLPQFHPFEENDSFWGKGFTEWTNVSKAVPQFEGHYQPKLPGELGFYDLRLKEVQQKQIELAKNYGLSGFCYYYYWFSGKKVMNHPIENLLKNKDLDFPFCLSWANENWTRRWDGDESNVLLGQVHTPEDDIEFIKEVSKYMLDKRYIRIDNKPILVVYRPTLFPDVNATVERWRTWCRENGIGEISLITTHQVFDSINPKDIGFDYAIEFAPMCHLRESQVEGVESVNLFNKNFNGLVLDYDSLLKHLINYEEPDYVKFRGITPSWDNEARKPGKGVIFHGSTPQKYQKWLEYILNYTKSKRKAEEQFVFINAWNEWAEGAMLEPDRKYGYAYLDATYNALKTTELSNREIIHNNNKKIAIVIHLYYFETWNLFETLLKNITFDFDLYITTSQEKSLDVNVLLKKNFPNAEILIYENRGRDILPFLKLYQQLSGMSYEYICKLHSKQSIHLGDGSNWGEFLIRDLLENASIIIEELEKNNKLGIIAPANTLLNNQDFIASNKEAMIAAQKKLNLDDPFNEKFVAGSMMWMRVASVQGIDKLFDFMEFELENSQLDGTKAHAVERLINSVALKNGYSAIEIKNDREIDTLPKQYQMQIAKTQ